MEQARGHLIAIAIFFTAETAFQYTDTTKAAIFAFCIPDAVLVLDIVTRRTRA
jgi:hypothetical protein